MIQFFKNVRRNLLAEGKSGKYLKYAIGETLLVMIGILLALQVNNWNEQRKSKRIENALLIELHKSVEEDIESIKIVIEQNQRYISSAETVLNTIENNSLFHDSIANHLNDGFKVWRVYIRTVAYDNLKEYGLQIIKNDQTRKEIIRAYSGRTRFVEELYDRYDQFIYNVVEPILADQMELREVEGYGNILFPVKGVDFDDNKLKYLLKKSISLKDQIIRAKQRTLNSFEKLHEQLQSEIHDS